MERETDFRRTAGVHIERPQTFFRWTIFPYAHCFGVAAFAFHLERGFRKSELLRAKLSDPTDPGLRQWLCLDNDTVKIEAFYGALQIEPWGPFKHLAVSDEGELYVDMERIDWFQPKDQAVAMFDAERPNARNQIKRTLSHSIIIDALQVRGRRESALAKKEEIEAGCFFAGLEWDRDRALFILDGAKLYDVELRVNPKLAPEDLEIGEESLAQAPSAKRAGILDAVARLWPDGVPAGVTVKERDRQIMAFIERTGITAPSARTIRRSLGTG